MEVQNDTLNFYVVLENDLILFLNMVELKRLQFLSKQNNIVDDLLKLAFLIQSFHESAKGL